MFLPHPSCCRLGSMEIPLKILYSSQQLRTLSYLLRKKLDDWHIGILGPYLQSAATNRERLMLSIKFCEHPVSLELCRSEVGIGIQLTQIIKLLPTYLELLHLTCWWKSPQHQSKESSNWNKQIERKWDFTILFWIGKLPHRWVRSKLSDLVLSARSINQSTAKERRTRDCWLLSAPPHHSAFFPLPWNVWKAMSQCGFGKECFKY